MKKAVVLGSLCALVLSSVAFSGGARLEDQRDRSNVFDVVSYDDFEAEGGYTLGDYQARWFNPFGVGEMDPAFHGDTRTFDDGRFSISAAPFMTSADFGVFDHIKYIAVGTRTFDIPRRGSIMFSADIEAFTPGTIPGHVIEGVYVDSGQPYQAVVLQGQQACATLHMVDFVTGQLFDWLVSGDKALALTERLPGNVTGPPNTTGIDLMYTQVIDEFDVAPGPHNYAIRYTRKVNFDEVEFMIDGHVVTRYRNIGVPLDKQGIDFIAYPSLGDGEPLKDKLQSFSIAHGVFSLLDAFPYQHPDAPEYNVSIPIENRIFGQGVNATYDNFKITTKTLP
jgi:hypothetical protein